MRFPIYFLFLALTFSNCKPNGASEIPAATIDDANYDGSEESKSTSASENELSMSDTMSYHDQYKGRSITGHFRYMADAASFTPCGEKKSFNVAMEGEEYLKTERSYGNAVEKGGDEAFIEVLGAWEEKANMEDRIVKTLVIHQLIELNPYRDCE